MVLKPGNCFLFHEIAQMADQASVVYFIKRLGEVQEYTIKLHVFICDACHLVSSETKLVSGRSFGDVCELACR